MPRRRRLFFPGSTYHVIMRGNKRMRLFHDDIDRRRFYYLIKEGVDRFEHKILAFCLMDNHVHLVVRAKEIPLSQICHNLASRYSRFYNYKHKKTGHVFEGRFKSFLVRDRNYLRTLIRYVHLNPVKAGLTELPELYRWSSHRAYLYQENLPWLSPEIGLSCFGVVPSGDVRPFEKFVLAGIGRDDDFDFESGKPTLHIDALVRVIRSSYLGNGERALSHSKLCALTTIFARKTKGIGIDEIAEYFGRQPESVRKAASRLQAQIRDSAELQGEMESLWHNLLPT